MTQQVKIPSVGRKITVNADFTLSVPDQPIIPYLEGDGIEKNFALVKDFLGRTTHVHELDGGGKSSHGGPYPFDKLAKLLVDADYDGWVLLEAASKPEDKVKALGEQKRLWEKLVAAAT